MNTLSLKQVYSKALSEVPININHDYNLRKMRERLWKEFDSIWIEYNEGNATFQQWEKALNKWLQAERI